MDVQTCKQNQDAQIFPFLRSKKILIVVSKMNFRLSPLSIKVSSNKSNTLKQSIIISHLLGPTLTPKLAEVRRGSSVEITGINPFYHNRGRRQSTDLYVRKKHSLDNQLTIDSISSQIHIGI